MKVKIIGRMANATGNYAPGSVIEVSDELGRKLVDSNQAHEVEGPKDEPVKRKPEVAQPVERSSMPPHQNTSTPPVAGSGTQKTTQVETPAGDKQNPK